jgi:hypothetical protein
MLRAIRNNFSTSIKPNEAWRIQVTKKSTPMKTNTFNFNWKSIALSTVFIATSMVGCKDNSEDFADEEATVQNAAVGDNEADDASQVSYAAEFDAKGARAERALPACAVVTNDKTNKILTIDFGTGCTGAYGRTRSGKILIQYSGVLGDSLANRTITFENYKVNSKSIEGTIEVRDILKNASGNLQATRKLTNLKVTFASGKSITVNGSRTREWIAGAGDGNPDNNQYRITGTLEGTTSTGRSFTQEITTPIVVDFACAKEGKFARVSGVVEFTKVGGFGTRKRTVDYGDGTCDNTITVTTFRRTYTITVD